MQSICALLYNCDPHKSLGGSCDRDITNVTKFLLSLDDYHCEIYNRLDPNKYSFKDICNDFINNIKETHSFVVIYLSGHGYQTRDNNGDELDGLDEYISTKFGRILDDDIHSLLIEKIPSNVKFIGISDTCHSGSMFDLTYPVNLNSKIYNCLSIGACADNELENCDIGHSIGFGGALTIQLLESKVDGKCLLKYILDNFDRPKNVIKVKSLLSQKLKVFSQHPVIFHN